MKRLFVLLAFQFVDLCFKMIMLAFGQPPHCLQQTQQKTLSLINIKGAFIRSITTIATPEYWDMLGPNWKSVTSSNTMGIWKNANQHFVPRCSTSAVLSFGKQFLWFQASYSASSHQPSSEIGSQVCFCHSASKASATLVGIIY